MSRGVWRFGCRARPTTTTARRLQLASRGGVGPRGRGCGHDPWARTAARLDMTNRRACQSSRFYAPVGSTTLQCLETVPPMRHRSAHAPRAPYQQGGSPGLAPAHPLRIVSYNPSRQDNTRSTRRAAGQRITVPCTSVDYRVRQPRVASVHRSPCSMSRQRLPRVVSDMAACCQRDMMVVVYTSTAVHGV